MLDVWPIVFGGLLLAWVAWCYNRLIRLRNMVNTAWSDIDVQLTRRHDLIPQLVRTVNAYTRHERALLATVTELRAQALRTDRKSTRLNSSHVAISYAVFCLKKKKAQHVMQ